MVSKRRQVISYVEEDTFQPPPTLRELGIERIIGRVVTGWRSGWGSYGMGGPGFFVLELGEANEFPSELLVLMLGGGMHWLLLDGQWFCAHPKLWGKQRPLFSHFGHWSKLEAFADIKGLENWDEVSLILVGAVLEDAVIEDKR